MPIRQALVHSRLLSTLAIAIAGVVAACGHDEHHEFDNLPDCVLDHNSLPEAQAIAHCLVDFPELHNGFADHAECVAFIEANGGYPNSRDAACTDYFEETES